MWGRWMRTIWCRLCKVKLEHVGGDLPTTCPECEQSAHWSAVEVPQKDYVLNENDRLFLKSIRIASNNDVEDDCA